MFKIVLICAFGIAASNADAPGDPPKVYCGEIPYKIFECLGSPRIIKPESSMKCDKSISECDKMRCIFREEGWMVNNMVDKSKVGANFDQFGKDNPDWAAAIGAAKTECLAQELPAQGVFIGCPAYDILHCTLTTLIRNANPAKWSSSEECKYPRQYAGACPICPSNCFVPAIPTGSCNACLSLPRTP
ncbi:uncharacterized protein LOC115445918 [Manduca sexta]|uniref:uncharacterized protein LOC115445918 n=1 Tax=Manduca sexta TaxID=7130 RepID=UPI00188EC3B5|nr:uncharacterized protein LOC115445918 [Manduca sexta]